MKKLILTILFAAVALPYAASDALAHGGQYRGPGGALPPNLREPHDPTPPVPAPPTGGPITEPPTEGPQRPTSPVTPGDPGNGTPSTGLSGNGKARPGGRATITPDSWVFWYEYNKDALQQLKRGIYRFNGTKGHPFGGLVKTGAGARSAQRHGTRAAVRSVVLPALLWAMDPKNSIHQDTESAAYIALAKVTDSPLHVELLQKGITSKNVITQEAAAMSFGLLRRERAADQFDGATLDKVRTFLFDVFENEEHPARMRGFAALSLGLLGDQPHAGDRKAGAARVTGRLFEFLGRPYSNQDLPVSLLTAISLQPRDTITRDHFAMLRTCISKGRIAREDVSPFVASYAAMVLGRVGDKDVDVLALRRALSTRKTSANVTRSAVIALGKLGQRCSAETRLEIAEQLRDGLRTKMIRDVTARSFAMISLAYLVEADVKAGRTDVMSRAKIGEFLVKRTQSGAHGERSYAALALGLICRAIGEETTVPLYGDFQSEARERLREGLASKGGARQRAAYAVALGLAKDRSSIGELTERVADNKEDDEMRGYAAIALGHIGVGSERVLKPIRAALEKRRSEKLRRATATALGMLTDRKAVPILMKELKKARSMSAKGQVVIALAKVGDERAIAPLVKLLRNRSEQHLTRALACAGLGIIGDIAWIPSLSLVGRDINYRASGDTMNEYLSIL